MKVARVLVSPERAMRCYYFKIHVCNIQLILIDGCYKLLNFAYYDLPGVEK